MDAKKAPLILVVGGTGTQGGNVASELLKFGHRVRVLSRDPASPAAQRIAEKGAQVIKGDLADLASVYPVMENVSAIFSVQYSDAYDTSIELRNAKNMVQAAQEMGVGQVVHTSVAGSNVFPRSNKYPLVIRYLEQKFAVEELVRQGGFHHWTILHPCWFMENYAEPLSGFMAPQLKSGRLFGIMHPDTPLKLNSGADTALFARTVFEDPDRFHEQDINVASQELSWAQIAATLTEVLSKKITYELVTPQQAVDQGLFEGTVMGTQWIEETGYGFDLSETRQYGIQLKTFAQWVDENRNRIVIY